MVERLAADLLKEFPSSAISRRKTSGSCAAFVRLDRRGLKLSQVVRGSATSALPAPISELPWEHNRLLLAKLETIVTTLVAQANNINHTTSNFISQF
jgi:hypothetical protein